MSSPLARIDVALNRIEAAVKRREESNSGVTRRHDALRQRVGEAVAALDELIARESAA